MFNQHYFFLFLIYQSALLKENHRGKSFNPYEEMLLKKNQTSRVSQALQKIMIAI